MSQESSPTPVPPPVGRRDSAPPAGPNGARAPSRSTIPLLILGAALALTALTAFQVDRAARAAERMRYQADVRYAARDLHERIIRRLDQHLALLRGLAGLYAAKQDVSVDEFRAYTTHLDLAGVFRGVRGIGFAKRVGPDGIPALEERLRNEGVADYRVHPAESPREVYFPIMYLEPQDSRNRQALGYDMFSDPTRADAMTRAWLNGVPAATGKVKLVQEVEGSNHPGFLVYQPVYRDGVVPATPEERESKLEGFAYCPFRAGDFIEALLGPDAQSAVHVAVFDGNSTSSDALLAGTPEVGDALPHQLVTFAGRPWRLVFTPAHPPPPALRVRAATVAALAGGGAISVLLFALARNQAAARRVAERNAAESRRREEQFHLIADALPALVSYVGRDGCYKFVNRAHEPFFGHPRGELPGKTLRDALGDAQYERVRPHVERALAGETVSFELESPDPAGGRLYHSVVYIPHRGGNGAVEGFVVLSTDVTEPRRREEELRHQLNLTRLITDHAADSLFLMDEWGRVTFMNPAAEVTFGWTQQELLGRVLHDVVHHHGPGGIQTPASDCPLFLSGVSITNHEDRFLCADGALVPVMCSNAPIVRDDRIIGAVLVVLDITERVRGEQERARLLTAEREARAEAESANRTKDEFLATLSHELRTPLNAILGWAQLLRMGAVEGEEATEGLLSIERNAKAQAQLVEDLLDVSRIISGKLRLNVKPVDLPAVIEAALASVRPAAEAKGIQIIPLMDSHAGPVAGDASRLQQVVWNLLSNAIKFTPKGGRVQVWLRGTGADVELGLSDTGIGINPEFLPHVFDRLRQADASSTRRHGGLGLGLAIVRHLVELHGGTVSAESPGEGKGATFTVRLPLAETQPHPVAPRTPAASSDPADLFGNGDHDTATTPPPPPRSLEGVRVLVVDDEHDAREVLGRSLRQWGADVTTVSSAQEAMEALRKARIDVLLSDIGMPGEDGYALIRRVRQLPDSEGGRIPAVALTAFARGEDRGRAISEGYQLHVPKPVEPTELATVVARLSGRGAQAPARL